MNNLIEAVKANNIERVAERLRSEFSRAFDVRQGVVRNQAVLTELLNRLSANQTILYSCVRTFVPGGNGRSRRLSTTTAADFGCGVHPGGWLTLFFGFDRSGVFYLLAPLDG